MAKSIHLRHYFVTNVSLNFHLGIITCHFFNHVASKNFYNDFSCASTDQNEPEGQNGGDVNSHPVETMDTDEPEKQEKPAAAKPAIRMSFAEYKRISNLLVLHMQKMEQRKSRFFHYNNVFLHFPIEV